MEPPSAEFCHQTLYYAGTRDPDLVLKWLYDALFDRLVKRMMARFKQGEKAAQDLAVGALEKILGHPLAQHRDRSFGEFLAFCHAQADWFAQNEFEKANALKRGARQTESLDQEGIEARIQQDPAKGIFTPGMMVDLVAAMAGLTKDERTIVTRFYLHGESLETIRNEHFPDTSISTLFDQKQRALRKLRQALER
jgi:DNA-directed RNA polymerase specialized sigma24 family protein